MRKVMLVGLLLGACGDDGGGLAVDAKQPDTVTSGKTVFLNRAGGTYSMGVDDATANVAGAMDMTRTLAPYPHDDASWTAVKTCVTQALAPFNVVVTDVDPGTAPHHEIVLTTKYWGDTSNTIVSSVSSAPCPAGSPGTHPAIPTSGVALVFAMGFTDPTSICEAAVSQLAVDIAGLDHSLDCHDFLGIYQTPCGAKSFLDQDEMCGEFSARVCNCGNATQNSHRAMTTALAN